MEFVDHFLSLDASVVLWADMLELFDNIGSKGQDSTGLCFTRFCSALTILEDSSRFLETELLYCKGHFLFSVSLKDPAEPLNGLRLLQPPPEPWPDICLPKVGKD